MYDRKDAAHVVMKEEDKYYRKTVIEEHLPKNCDRRTLTCCRGTKRVLFNVCVAIKWKKKIHCSVYNQ